MCIIVLVCTVFCDFSCCSVGSVEFIITDHHNVSLPLTLHPSRILHLVTYCKISDNTHSLTCIYDTGSLLQNPWSTLMRTWSYSMKLQEYWSTAPNSAQLYTFQLNSVYLNSTQIYCVLTLYLSWAESPMQGQLTNMAGVSLSWLCW